jgi:NAD(P)-dependent dehydrogenase (short-subunit alcohol dehydrogenase family)
MNLNLTKRVAVVTGSSQGIGSAVARQLAGEGAYVALTYHKEQARAEELASAIRADGREAFASHLDLASFDSIERTIEAVLNRWERIDILVNNAIQWGARPISQTPCFEKLSPAEWQPLLRTNMEGTFRITQAVTPQMREQQWGRIVNISSIAAEDGLIKGAWYTATKSFLHGLTRTLSKELGPYGILVNSVMPGLTATDRIALIAPEVRRRVEENTPIRRVLDPDEVANAIVFLCSPANSAITGEIIRVSGDRM